MAIAALFSTAGIAATAPQQLRNTTRQTTATNPFEKYAKEFAEKAKNATPVDLSRTNHIYISSARIKHRADADAKENWQTLLDEDFSLFTKGTEDAPDIDKSNPTSTMYPKDYFETGNTVLPDSLFHTPGWAGLGIYEAGGNCALAYPRMGGVLSTPEMNLHGHIRVTMRVKAINGKFMLMLPLAAGGHINSYDPIGNSQFNMFTLSPDDGWKDITVEYENPVNTNDCFIQFNGMNYNVGNLIINSLKIERDDNYVSVPGSLKASDFTSDGFTASWNKDSDTGSYLVNLYEKKTVGTENQHSDNTFEGISVADDGTVSGLAEGWTGSLKGTEDKQYVVKDDDFDGNSAAIFTTSDDNFTYDAGESSIADISLALKRLASDEDTYASVKIDFGTKDDWTASYTLEDFSKVPADKWTTYKISELLNDFPVGKYTRFRIHASNLSLSKEYEIEGAVEEKLAVAALSAEATPKTETTCVKENAETTSNSMTFNGLDLENTYSFTVQAIGNNGNKSEVSERCVAYGVAAPEPMAATDINKRGAYTANWKAAAHATSYVLNSYEVKNIAEDTNNYSVFEENFNKCKDDQEANDNNYENLDDYADNNGWYGNGVRLTEGMIGCKDGEGKTEYDLHSPEITLDNADEYTVNVTFKVADANTGLVVQGGDVDYKVLKPGTTDLTTMSVTLKGGTKFTRLMFYSNDTKAFLIDKVTVSQDVKKGDRLFTKLSTEEVKDAATSFRVSGLTPKEGYSFAYNLYSVWNRFGKEYQSVRSATQIVNLGTSTGIGSIATDDTTNARPEYFDLSGRRVSTKQGKGVYIMKTGTAVKKIANKE